METTGFRLDLIESNDTTFPDDELARLEEQINRPKWSIPVYHDGELISCLRSAIVLVYKSQSIVSK